MRSLVVFFILGIHGTARAGGIDDTSRCSKGLSPDIDEWEEALREFNIKPWRSWWPTFSFSGRKRKCQQDLCMAFLKAHERALEFQRPELMRRIVLLAEKGIQSHGKCKRSLDEIERAADEMKDIAHESTEKAKMKDIAPVYRKGGSESYSNIGRGGYPTNYPIILNGRPYSQIYDEPPQPSSLNHYHSPGSSIDWNWNVGQTVSDFVSSAVGTVKGAFSGITNNRIVRDAAGKAENAFEVAENAHYGDGARLGVGAVKRGASIAANAAETAYSRISNDPRVLYGADAIKNEAGDMLGKAQDFDYGAGAKNFAGRARDGAEVAFDQAKTMDYEDVGRTVAGVAKRGASTASDVLSTVSSDDRARNAAGFIKHNAEGFYDRAKKVDYERVGNSAYGMAENVDNGEISGSFSESVEAFLKLLSRS